MRTATSTNAPAETPHAQGSRGRARDHGGFPGSHAGDRHAVPVDQLGQIRQRELAGTDQVVRACLAFAHRGLGEGVEDVCGVGGAEALCAVADDLNQRARGRLAEHQLERSRCLTSTNECVDAEDHVVRHGADQLFSLAFGLDVPVVVRGVRTDVRQIDEPGVRAHRVDDSARRGDRAGFVAVPVGCCEHPTEVDHHGCVGEGLDRPRGLHPVFDDLVSGQLLVVSDERDDVHGLIGQSWQEIASGAAVRAGHNDGGG
jgi:hypothetical protein